MGTPLGTSVANIFMSALEQRFLDKCPAEFKPTLYRRYVHDTFWIFRNKQQVDKFLSSIQGSYKLF